MFAKRFFYVCSGLLCLALAYHLGASSAQGQAGSPVSGFASVGTGTVFYVLTPSGDAYYRTTTSGVFTGPLYSMGNFWTAATPTQRETWGAVKSRYRGAASQSR